MTVADKEGRNAKTHKIMGNIQKITMYWVENGQGYPLS